MSTLFILSIDSDDDYQATLHESRELALAELRDWAYRAGYDLDAFDSWNGSALGGTSPDTALIEWLHDAESHNVETNITEVPRPAMTRKIEIASRSVNDVRRALAGTGAQIIEEGPTPGAIGYTTITLEQQAQDDRAQAARGYYSGLRDGRIEGWEGASKGCDFEHGVSPYA